MDAEKLIEEAERWAKNVSESPGNGTAGEDLYGAKLLFNLAAALRETTARAEAAEYDAASVRAAVKVSELTTLADEMSGRVRAELALSRATQERDALAAANVAANKRIEALEHDRDAARAELAQPSICPNCTAKMRRLDRMDSAGHAAYELDKARKDAAGQNKRAQKAEQQAKALRAELARLTTPRPIAEAPRDGTWIVGFWDDAPPKVIRRWAEQWRDYMGASVAWRGLTHFLPLPVLP